MVDVKSSRYWFGINSSSLCLIINYVHSKRKFITLPLAIQINCYTETLQIKMRKDVFEWNGIFSNVRKWLADTRGRVDRQKEKKGGKFSINVR